MTLDELNRTGGQSAADVLKPCCGSQRWAEGLSVRRPFRTMADLHKAADLVAQTLGREDWLEAFSSHPLIGETKSVSPWSEKEQEGISTAGEDVKSSLPRLNREYQERYGFIFIICATGKSAEEILMQLQERMQNQVEDELRTARVEQIKIVHLRLDKLIAESAHR